MKPIIEVENISKLYKLGTIGTTTLRDSVERMWYKLCRKDKLLNKVGGKHLMIEPKDPQAWQEPNTVHRLHRLHR